jgi:hypothetical protein
MQAPHPTVPPDAQNTVAWGAKVICGRKLVLYPKQAGKAIVPGTRADAGCTGKAL